MSTAFDIFSRNGVPFFFSEAIRQSCFLLFLIISSASLSILRKTFSYSKKFSFIIKYINFLKRIYMKKQHFKKRILLMEGGTFAAFNKKIFICHGGLFYTWYCNHLFKILVTRPAKRSAALFEQLDPFPFYVYGFIFFFHADGNWFPYVFLFEPTFVEPISNPCTIGARFLF